MTSPCAVQTARLFLQPVRLVDADEVHALFAHEEVYRYLTDGVVVSRAWVEDVIRDSATSFVERGLGLWAAREQETSAIIGLTGFREFYDPPIFELLYALKPSHWHRGFAMEMARAAIDYAFTHTSMMDVRASTDEPNRASVRVLERLGMRPHGRTSVADAKSICWDQLHFILSRADWQTHVSGLSSLP